jgi:hypothetical protein
MPAAVTAAAVTAPPPTPEQLVAQWQGLAHQRASWFLSQNGWLARSRQDVDDAHEEALYALGVACCTWRAEKGVKPGYYAQLVIDRHLWDYAAREGKRRGVPLPDGTRAAVTLASDIGEYSGVTGDFLDAVPDPDAPDPTAVPARKGEGDSLEDAKVKEWLRGLGFTERSIAIGYMLGAEKMSHKEVAEALGGGLTAEAVRALAGDVVVSVRRVVWGDGGGGAAGEGPGLFDGQ